MADTQNKGEKKQTKVHIEVEKHPGEDDEVLINRSHEFAKALFGPEATFSEIYEVKELDRFGVAKVSGEVDVPFPR